MKVRAVVSLGSNYGNRELRIKQALKILKEFGEILSYSGIYETDAIDGVSASYLNSVLVFTTDLSHQELIDKFKEIEIQLGRDKSKLARTEVPIDIDLVIYDNNILRPEDYSRSYFRRGLQLINEKIIWQP